MGITPSFAGYALLALAFAASASAYQPSAASPSPASATSATDVSPAADGKGPFPFEVAPNVGFMGGSALLGVRACMNYYPISFELSADQVLGRTATLFPITLNAVLDLADNTARTVPYGIIGGGLFLTVPLNSVGDQTISSVGFAFGGGLRYYVTRRVGIRFETKQLFTRIDNRQDSRQEILIFQSTSLGVIFGFG